MVDLFFISVYLIFISKSLFISFYVGFMLHIIFKSIYVGSQYLNAVGNISVGLWFIWTIMLDNYGLILRLEIFIRHCMTQKTKYSFGKKNSRKLISLAHNTLSQYFESPLITCSTAYLVANLTQGLITLGVRRSSW
jgi:hypothetical protein